MSEQWLGPPHPCGVCGRTISTSNHRVCATCRRRMKDGVPTDTPITTPLRGSLNDRFLAIWLTLSPDERGCIIWPRQKSGRGRNYGWIVAPGRKMQHAHRVSYEFHKGAIPDGMIVMHSCDNPDHLSIGTHKDNSQDMVMKGRHGGVSEATRAARWDK